MSSVQLKKGTANDYESEYATESDSDLSLPDIVRARPSGKGPKHAWTLAQEEQYGGSTDNSDLEGYVEDLVIGKKNTEMPAMDNATVWFKSTDSKVKGRRISVPRITLDDQDSIAKNGTMDDDDGWKSDTTTNEDLALNLSDYRFIMKEEVLVQHPELQLKSYESLVRAKCTNYSTSTSSRNETIKNNEGGSETSEGDVSDMDVQPKKKCQKTKAKRCDRDSGNDSTDDSDVEVSMKDYYAIRHQNDVDRLHRRLSLQEALQTIQFRPKFQDTFGLQAHNSGPDTDEESVDSEGESGDASDDDTEHSDVKVTMKDYYMIRKETTPKDAGMNEFILQMNPVESNVHMNSSQASPREEDVDTDDEEMVITFDEDNASLDFKARMDEQLLSQKNTASRKCPPGQQKLKKVVRRRNLRPVKAEGNDTEDEEFPCTESDIMSLKDFVYSCRTNFDMMAQGVEPTYSKIKSNPSVECQASENPSEDDSLSDSESYSHGTENEQVRDNSASLVDVVPNRRPGNIPVIRIVELEGLEGPVGIICDDPRSPTTDNVFGVQFLDAEVDLENVTDEISNVSDLDEDPQRIQLRDSDSPNTEDEEMSDIDYEQNNPHCYKTGRACQRKINRSEFVLPSPKKNVITLKENKDGSTSKRIIELHDPREVLSLDQFIKEIEGVSETDIIHVSDDEIDGGPKELPKDKAVKEDQKKGNKDQKSTKRRPRRRGPKNTSKA